MVDIDNSVTLDDMVEFIEHVRHIQNENPNNKPCIYLKGTNFAIGTDQKEIDDKIIVVRSKDLAEITNFIHEGSITQTSEPIFMGISRLMKALTEFEDKVKRECGTNE